jgi:hypothetical protein
MSKLLSKGAAKAYLADPYHCPYCKSNGTKWPGITHEDEDRDE